MAKHTSWGVPVWNLGYISQSIEDRIGLGTTQQMMPGFKHTLKHFAPIEPPVKDNQSTGNVRAYPLQNSVAAILLCLAYQVHPNGKQYVSVTVLQSNPNAQTDAWSSIDFCCACGNDDF